PKSWLEDGKTIKVKRAPTAFGPVSIEARSKLAAGEIIVDVTLPKRNHPARTLLRARVPDGWKVASAQIGSKQLSVDEKGTSDISNLKGKKTVRLKVVKLGVRSDCKK